MEAYLIAVASADLADMTQPLAMQILPERSWSAMARNRALPPFWMDMRLADSILTSEVRSPQQRIKDKSCPTPTALFEEVSPSLSLANGIV